jgi:hypothetical protein
VVLQLVATLNAALAPPTQYLVVCPQIFAFIKRIAVITRKTLASGFSSTGEAGKS